MMIKKIENEFNEKARDGENFESFRERMVTKALEEDLGILGYHLDGKIYAANYNPAANDGVGLSAWTDMSCDLRQKALIVSTAS